MFLSGVDNFKLISSINHKAKIVTNHFLICPKPFCEDITVESFRVLMPWRKSLITANTKKKTSTNPQSDGENRFILWNYTIKNSCRDLAVFGRNEARLERASL